MKEVEHMAMLFDFYGRLLTAKQQEIFLLYYEQDLSLGEIAEEYGVTRQAVRDILKRGEKFLEGYEQKLGLVRKYNIEQENIEQALVILDDAANLPGTVNTVKKLLREVLDLQQGD